jgi:hypothetical protein
MSTAPAQCTDAQFGAFAKTLRVVLVTVALAAAIIVLPAGAARAQMCGAYTDEMAGPGGTYGSPAECSSVEGLPDSGVGIGGAPNEPTVAGRDNPDAPPVYRDTATDEGEREQ